MTEAGSSGERVWLHQVGARGGTTDLDAMLLGPLAVSCSVALYEPAADAMNELYERSAGRNCSTVVLPYALSDQTGRAVLNMTYCPKVASLREPIESAFTSNAPGFDYPVTEAARVTERTDVAVYRLDELPELLNERIGPPDILAVSAPGSEYEVLAGAGELLKGVSAIVAVLPYAAQYAGARPFGDVVAMVKGRGFRFANALADIVAQPFRVPIGFRGNDWQVASKVLFLRSIDEVEDDPIALRKLAFTSHVFGQAAYGFECSLRYVERHGTDFGTMAYGRLLAELNGVLGRMPALRTVSFNELYTVDESYARSDPARQQAVHASVMARGKKIVGAAIAQGDVVNALLGKNDTPIEATFRSFGLVWQADVLKLRRRQDLVRYFDSLGFAVRLES